MKFLSVLFFILLPLIFLSGICNAQSFSVGGGLSYAADNSNVKGNIGFEGNLTILTESIIAIRASVGRYGSDIKVNQLSEGDYSLLWIEGTFLLRGKSPKVQPYGGIGGGYYITGHELSSRVTSLLALFGIRGKEDIQDVFGIHFRGGLDVPISLTVAINVDLKYVILKPDVKVEATNIYTYQTASVTESVDLSTFIIGFGISVTL
jgi:outer membrane protein W